ncbi:MAG: PilN domain-containing protein [Myxococcota bacterium]
MIRINLLPQAKQRKGAGVPSGSTAVWLVAYLTGAVIWCVALGVVYFLYQGRLDEQKQKNASLEERIQVIEKKSEGLDELEARLERSKQLEALVDDLNRGRTGPTRVLKELSDILSKGNGPSIDRQELERMRRDNPLAGYNRSWDVRRLWVDSFHEEHKECRIRGQGKTNEDVAEFLRRLALSELFTTVTLQRTEMVEDSETKLPLVGFELTCEVRY